MKNPPTTQSYKQTEIGVIPEDWDVKKVDDLVHFNNGKAHEKFITENGDYIVVNSKFISTEGEVFKTSGKNLSPLSDGEITMVMSDIPNGKALAKCFFIRKNNRYTLNQRICSFKSKGADSEYLFYKLNRNKYFLDFDSGVGQTNLKRSDVLNCPVVIPTKKDEQTAIATALSDTDALIEKLEKLIAKKKAIKQGATQQLLNPYDCKGNLKKGWKFQSLFDLADSKKDLFDDGDWIEAEHITSKGVRLIQTGNIGVGKYVEKEPKKYIYEESFDRLKCKLLKQGDLLICRLAEPAGRACVLPNIGDLRVITSVDVTIFRPRKEVANRYYLANLFSTDWWFQKVNESVGGTTHKRISKGALGKIIIPIPTIDDQNLSATVLSDMDAEIEKLENKLNKYHQIKTGMMQQLLTGKIRLVKNLL